MLNNMIDYQYSEKIVSFDDDYILLDKYIRLFLQYSSTAQELDDSRILLFRGQDNFKYSLTPSVFRNNFISNEQILINKMLMYSPEEFQGLNSILEKLIKMQHYGLPTRLLDVTLNPLVALYFACHSSPNEDGEILIFYDYLSRANDENVLALAMLAEYNGSSEEQLKEHYKKNNINNINIKEVIKRTYIPFEAPLNNERIRRQHGAFIVFGMSDDQSYQKSCFNLKPIVIKNYGDDIARSIIVPHQDKAQLLHELDIIGINHGFLFPEFEHQASYIKNIFS